MSTFVLVHGAWQSTGTWDLLTPLLRKQGHRVVTPVLRGLGTDQDHLTSDIALSEHIQDVSDALEKLNDNDKVILVGHSYAGMVISGAVEAKPDKVERLVFLDAFVPEDGQSVLDLLPPAVGVSFRKIAQESGNGWRLPGGEGQLDMWGLKPGKARDFVKTKLCDFTLRCFEEPVRLSANRKADGSASYVSCVAEGYPARPLFEPFAQRARNAGWHVSQVDTGHDCHVERPEEIANILLSAATPA
jgi:pimeloyl-ACP methyl ester carboxylesterase